MTKLMFAAVGATMLLSAASAFAQGLPAGTQPPVYGSVWAAQKLASEQQNAPSLASNQAQPTQSRTADQSGAASSPRL